MASVSAAPPVAPATRSDRLIKRPPLPLTTLPAQAFCGHDDEDGQPARGGLDQDGAHPDGSRLHCRRLVGSTPAKARKSIIRKSPVTRPLIVGSVGRPRECPA